MKTFKGTIGTHLSVHKLREIEENPNEPRCNKIKAKKALLKRGERVSL